MAHAFQTQRWQLLPTLYTHGPTLLGHSRRRNTTNAPQHQSAEPTNEHISIRCQDAAASYYLAGGAVACSLVGALGVRMVGSRLIRSVGPSDLIRASAIRAVTGLEKFLAVLNSMFSMYSIQESKCSVLLRRGSCRMYIRSHVSMKDRKIEVRERFCLRGWNKEGSHLLSGGAKPHSSRCTQNQGKNAGRYE